MTINLVPPQIKKQKDTKVILFQAYLISSAVLIMLLISATSIFLANGFFERKTADTEEKIISATKQMAKYKPIDDKLRRANQKIDSLEKMNGDRVLWTQVMAELEKSTPSNIQIQSLTLNKETKRITLMGIAENRKNIAEMKEAMESSDIFKNVTFSSSSYNDKGLDFSFSLGAELEGV